MLEKRRYPNFFGIVGSLYDFIEGSLKRHAAFQAIREEIQMETGSDLRKGYKTLHSMSTTRWPSRIDNCQALLTNVELSALWNLYLLLTTVIAKQLVMPLVC